MSGLKLVIPTSFTDNTLPMLRDDPVFPAAGAMLLLEPAHPANPIAAGVPADNTAVPNLAATQAAAMLGVSSSSLGATFYLKGGINNGTKGKVERTTQGGLHVIESRTTGLVAGDGVGIQASQAVRNWVSNGGGGAGHKFYISAWGRITRAKTSGAFEALFELDAGNFNFAIGALKYGGVAGWQGNPASDYVVAPPATKVPSGWGNTPSYSGLFDTDVSITCPTGSSGPPQNSNFSFGPVWGAITQFTNYGQNGSTITAVGTDRPSWVFYRLYVEDLNVSGRTYAQVSALDAAEYTAQVLTAGGRYYGDTYTDPATIA
jgi:hypothetical protein